MHAHACTRDASRETIADHCARLPKIWRRKRACSKTGGGARARSRSCTHARPLQPVLLHCDCVEHHLAPRCAVLSRSKAGAGRRGGVGTGGRWVYLARGESTGRTAHGTRHCAHAYSSTRASTSRTQVPSETSREVSDAPVQHLLSDGPSAVRATAQAPTGAQVCPEVHS